MREPARLMALPLLIGALTCTTAYKAWGGQESGSAIAPRDQDVLDVVLGDLLSFAAGHSPVSERGRPPKSLAFSSRSANWPISVESVLYRHEPEPWQRLPATALPQLQVAAEDLVERTARGGFSSFKSTNHRVTVRAPADKETTGEALYDRFIQAWPPGYSPDGSLAVVCLTLPWSIHSATATYVLTKSATGWAVVVRQFVYYV
jgi:hypothetical protein